MGDEVSALSFGGEANIQSIAAPVAKTSQLSQIYNGIFQDNKLHTPTRLCRGINFTNIVQN